MLSFLSFFVRQIVVLLVRNMFGTFGTMFGANTGAVDRVFEGPGTGVPVMWGLLARHHVQKNVKEKNGIPVKVC